MKNAFGTAFLFIGVLLVSQSTWAQAQLYATTRGTTSFHSSTPAEDINAVNQKTQVLLNTATGEIAVLMNMRDFDFPNDLMEEHFNENYIESEKYPKATFKGKLNRSVDPSESGTFPLAATGTFTVHGVSKNRTLEGTLRVQDGKLLLESTFEVALVDHKIDVPKIVFMKIAQVIEVKSTYELTPYVKQ